MLPLIFTLLATIAIFCLIVWSYRRFKLKLIPDDLVLKPAESKYEIPRSKNEKDNIEEIQ